MSDTNYDLAIFTSEEEEAVSRIIWRARSFCARKGVEFDQPTLYFSLARVHLHTPMRLAELANGSDRDLLHDVFGILNHIDHRTGQLRDCFSPRCSR